MTVFVALGIVLMVAAVAFVLYPLLAPAPSGSVAESTDPELEAMRTQQMITGEVPSVLNPPPGCPFHPRCPIAEKRCAEEVPQLRRSASGRSVACHLATV